MNVSAGWFVSSPCDVEMVEHLFNFEKNIQVSFYERQDLAWTLALSPFSSRITSIHLPKGLSLSDYCEGGVVDNLMEAFSTNLFVVHPWADDLSYIVETVMEREKFCLCLEGFSLGKPKGGLLDLVERFGKDMKTSPYVGICLDFAHIEPEVMCWKFVKAMLPYTKMFHVSSVVDGHPHRQMYSGLSEFLVRPILTQFLNLPETPVKEVVLEYDKEYKNDLLKDAARLSSWVDEKRRKFNHVK